MRTATAKLSGAFRVTIPKAVGEALNLRPGDKLAFDMVDGNVRLRRVRSLDRPFAEAIAPVLCEWSSDADEEAYRDL